jgi:hypothetical protein
LVDAALNHEMKFNKYRVIKLSDSVEPLKPPDLIDAQLVPINQLL